jgi:stage II sporulation protein D
MKTAPVALAALLSVGLAAGCTRMAALSVTQVAPELERPVVRVILADDLDSVRISSTRTYRIDVVRAHDDTVTFYTISPMVIRRAMTGLLLVDRGWYILEANIESIRIAPQEAGGYVRVDGRPYRGDVRVRAAGENSLAVINRLSMESYLFGVVPGEIGFIDPGTVPAIQAQAVAARTYAFAHLGQYGDKDFDLRADVLDQVYSGLAVEHPLVTQAVWSTRGRVLRYNGEYVRAYYHSTCGGVTENVEEVWDQPPQPYLVAVDDDRYCAWSKYWDWTEVCTRAWLDSNVAAFLKNEKLGSSKALGRLRGLEITRRRRSGRVDELLLKFDHGRVPVRGDKSRWALGRPSRRTGILPAANYTIEFDREGGGWRKVTVRGHGYGHGVGMCQCGAIGRARAGQSYEEILKAYYTGADLATEY